MIPIHVSLSINLDVVCAPDRQSEAMGEVEKTIGIINDFVAGEKRRLSRIFPADDFAQDNSQRKGCCG